jgi:IS5 family transposase
MKEYQTEIINLDTLMPEKHTYRKFKELINFEKLVKAAKVPEKECGAIGYTANRLVKCLILQFTEDASDRTFERFMRENIAGKWFCEFGISEETPDYTTFCKFRNMLGKEKITFIFEELKRQLKKKGYMAEVFTFVDASALISRLSMWEERDEAIKAGYEKLNNETIEKFSSDPEVRIGAKSKNKFWFGFKKHVSVDMGSGMINKVSVTQANVPDADGAAAVLPGEGAVCADKGYVGAIETIEKAGLHSMVILKNNMKEKNAEKDKFFSKLRAPFEGVFSKQNKRVRYKGAEKNHVAELLYAIAFNMRRLVAINT